MKISKIRFWFHRIMRLTLIHDGIIQIPAQYLISLLLSSSGARLVSTRIRKGYSYSPLNSVHSKKIVHDLISLCQRPQLASCFIEYIMDQLSKQSKNYFCICFVESVFSKKTHLPTQWAFINKNSTIKSPWCQGLL